MTFNPEKCEVIRITKKKEKKTVLFDYKLHGITLQLTKNAKISRHPNLRRFSIEQTHQSDD